MSVFSQDPLGAAQHQIINAEYDGAGNLLYLGLAVPGVAVADQAWLVAKFIYDGSNRFLTKRFANGSLDYNQRWTDRAGLTYA